jgi:molecular chaperone DnaK
VKVDVDGKQFTPPEVSAMILRKLKEAAEAYLGHTVRKAVITVPAYFNDAQRQATIDAAVVAGFDAEWEIEDPKTKQKSKQRMRIINEPTAAALAYGFDKRGKDQKIAVFDLGGGTFDISILELYEIDGVANFQVKSTNGDTHLGGDDFDQVLIDYIAEEFKKENGVDLRKDPMAMQRLKDEGEKVKKYLSQQTNAEVNLPFITAIDGVPKHINLSITRAQFERMVDHLIERCKGPVLRALDDAGMKPADVDEVVMVGGMTRMPRVQQLVKEIFGKEGHKGVNPDEVVAVGAAHQGAALLLGSKSDLLLLDVTPLTLGIETQYGRMTPMIPRNTAIPAKKTEIFTTAADNQPSVDVKVFQGERPIAADNKKIGEFHLDGIQPAPANVPKIEVTFDLDANGILNVTAKDQGTGKQNNVRIEHSSGLNQAEIDRMKRDAETHADEDKRKRELADVRHEGDQKAYQLDKMLKEAGDKIGEADKAPLLKAIERVRDAVKGTDVAAIKSAIQDLDTAAQAMGQHLQGQAGQGGPTGASPSGNEQKKGGDDVIDAEYEVKK